MNFFTYVLGCFLLIPHTHIKLHVCSHSTLRYVYTLIHDTKTFDKSNLLLLTLVCCVRFRVNLPCRDVLNFF